MTSAASRQFLILEVETALVAIEFLGVDEFLAMNDTEDSFVEILVRDVETEFFKVGKQNSPKTSIRKKTPTGTPKNESPPPDLVIPTEPKLEPEIIEEEEDNTADQILEKIVVKETPLSSSNERKGPSSEIIKLEKRSSIDSKPRRPSIKVTLSETHVNTDTEKTSGKRTPTKEKIHLLPESRARSVPLENHHSAILQKKPAWNGSPNLNSKLQRAAELAYVTSPKVSLESKNSSTYSQDTRDDFNVELSVRVKKRNQERKLNEQGYHPEIVEKMLEEMQKVEEQKAKQKKKLKTMKKTIDKHRQELETLKKQLTESKKAQETKEHFLDKEKVDREKFESMQKQMKELEVALEKALTEQSQLQAEDNNKHKKGLGIFGNFLKASESSSSSSGGGFLKSIQNGFKKLITGRGKKVRKFDTPHFQNPDNIRVEMEKLKKELEEKAMELVFVEEEVEKMKEDNTDKASLDEKRQFIEQLLVDMQEEHDELERLLQKAEAPEPEMDTGAPPDDDVPPPPPGFDGDIPPPPPGFGDGPEESTLPTHRTPSPNVKMKGFQWSKLPNSKVKNTFWVEAQSVEIEHFQTELEDLFCAKDFKKEKKEEETTTTKSRVSIVDRQQANNLAIILSRLKMSAAKIREAILLLDSSRLKPEDIAALAKFSLSKKELSSLLAVEDRSTFGVAERFFWETTQIPRLQIRLKTWEFTLVFSAKIKDVRSQIETFQKACQELRNSKQFSSILELVLAIGNFFNSGSQRGQAYGFKLDSLLRLAETKTTDNKKNLLHYFAHLLESKFPQYLNFREEIPSIPFAAKLNSQAVQHEVSEMKTMWKLIQDELKINHEENYQRKFCAFVTNHKDDIPQLDQDYRDMQESSRSLVDYFGQEGFQFIEELFLIVHNFSTALAKSSQDNLKSAIVERRASTGVVDRKDSLVEAKVEVEGIKPLIAPTDSA